MREIEHRRIVVLIANLRPERAEPGEARIALVLGLHRHLEVRHANLTLAIKDVCCSYDACDRIDLEAIAALVVRLHEGVSDVAIGAGVQIDGFNLQFIRSFVLIVSLVQIFRSSPEIILLIQIIIQTIKKFNHSFIHSDHSIRSDNSLDHSDHKSR